MGRLAGDEAVAIILESHTFSYRFSALAINHVLYINTHVLL